jgi:hypothetical protein
MWERVPELNRHFSQENLEGLVKFAYFGGFINIVPGSPLPAGG